MKIGRSITSVIVCLSLLQAHCASRSSGQQNEPASIECSVSVTVIDGVETSIDTDADGLSASANQGIVNCNIGRFFQHGVAEFGEPVPGSTNCPEGQLEFTIVSHAVWTDIDTGDQLFGESPALVNCVNPAPGLPFTLMGTLTFSGGTGRFGGATGTAEITSASGKYLVTGSKGGVFGGFAQFTFTATGTLTLAQPQTGEA
jgi:hypothetical protein